MLSALYVLSSYIFIYNLSYKIDVQNSDGVTSKPVGISRSHKNSN